MNQLNASWLEWSLFPMISGGLGRLSGGDENQDCGVGTGDGVQRRPIMMLRLISMGTKNNTVCESSLSL